MNDVLLLLRLLLSERFCITADALCRPMLSLAGEGESTAGYTFLG
jgi:hypothetical protein